MWASNLFTGVNFNFIYFQTLEIKHGNSKQCLGGKQNDNEPTVGKIVNDYLNCPYTLYWGIYIYNVYRYIPTFKKE